MNPEYPGHKVLDLFSKYAINRNNQIFKLIDHSLNSGFPGVKKILEFGAGQGEFINRFTKNKNFETVAVETDPGYRQILSARLPVFEKLEDVQIKPDFIFLIDVLEHIQNDENTLQSIHDKLENNGGIFIYVPARMELYSKFDKSIGHFRRYSKEDLISKVKGAGFNIIKCNYHDILGYFVSLIHNKIFGIGEPDKNAVQFYDKLIVPATGFLEKIIKPPFGKSLYLLANVEKK